MISVFYYDEETGDTIDSLHPEVCSKQKALALFNVLSKTRDSFFGLVDQNNTTVQFICLKGNKWRLDIPVPEEGGAYFHIVKTDMCTGPLWSPVESLPILWRQSPPKRP